MPYFICPECYYTTDDVTKESCERCFTKLLRECPICEKPILEDNAIYCSECGSKMRRSYVPIQ